MYYTYGCISGDNFLSFLRRGGGRRNMVFGKNVDSCFIPLLAADHNPLFKVIQSSLSSLLEFKVVVIVEDKLAKQESYDSHHVRREPDTPLTPHTPTPLFPAHGDRHCMTQSCSASRIRTVLYIYICIYISFNIWLIATLSSEPRYAFYRSVKRKIC